MILQYDGFKFQTIPDFTYLPQSDYLVASEFGTVNYPIGRVSIFDEKGQKRHTFLTEGRFMHVHICFAPFYIQPKYR